MNPHIVYRKIHVGKNTWYIGYAYNSRCNYDLSIAMIDPSSLSSMDPLKITLDNGTTEVIAGYWCSNLVDFIDAISPVTAYVWPSSDQEYSWWQTNWPKSRVDKLLPLDAEERRHAFDVAGVRVLRELPPHLKDLPTHMHPK